MCARSSWPATASPASFCEATCWSDGWNWYDLQRLATCSPTSMQAVNAGVQVIDAITNLHGIQLPSTTWSGTTPSTWPGLRNSWPASSGTSPPLAKHYLHRYPANHKTANIWLRRMVDACAAAQSRFPIPVIHLRNDVRRELVAAEYAPLPDLAEQWHRT